MNDNWVSVYSTPDLYRAEIVKDMLTEKGIASIRMDTKDSVYLLGEYEIYVNSEQSFEAKQIITSFQSE